MASQQFAHQQGAALAVTLVLLAILLLTGISGMRAATTALRLSNALQDADHAFMLASRSIDDTLTSINANPATLPSSGTLQLPVLREPRGRAVAEIRYTGVQSCPAPLSGIRHDYEIRVTATAGRGATSHQRHYFYMCRPACSVSPCAETGPVNAGWVVTRPD